MAPHGQRRWALMWMVLSAVFFVIAAIFGFQEGVWLLLAVGMVTLLLGMNRPAVAVLSIGMLVMMDFHIHELSGASWIRWNTLIFLFIIVFGLYYPLLLRRLYLQVRLAAVLILLMGVWLLFSTSRFDGVQHILNMFIMFAMIPFFARLVRQGDDWFWFGVTIGVASIFVNVAYYLFTPPSDVSGGINSLAQSPLTGNMVVALVYHTVQSFYRRGILLLVASVTFGLVFLSASRGATIVALIPMAYLLISTLPFGVAQTAFTNIGKQRLLALHLAIGVAILIFGSLITVAIFPEFRNKTVSKFQIVLDTDRSLTERTNLRSVAASAGWDSFKEHPMGIGTGSFNDSFVRLGIRNDRGEFLSLSAHSAWTKVLTENGVFGIALLFAFVLSYAYSGFRARGADSKSLRLLGVTIALVLGTGMLFTLFDNKGFWMVAAAGAVLLNTRRTEDTAKSPSPESLQVT